MPVPCLGRALRRALIPTGSSVRPTRVAVSAIVSRVPDGWIQQQGSRCGVSCNRGVYVHQGRGLASGSVPADSEHVVPTGTGDNLSGDKHMGWKRHEDVSGQQNRLAGCGDKIFLQGMEFHSYHGCLPEEKRLGQKFVVDVTLHCSLRKAGLSDCLADSVDYAAVYRHVQERVEGPSRDLIEAVAEDVAAYILAQHQAVQAVQVAVYKPHVALPGSFRSMGVEITRSRVPDEQA